MARMRHYDRAEYRHLDDADHFRDYDYLADDSWAGPNEHSPEPLAAQREPPPRELRSRRPAPVFEAPRGMLGFLLYPRETLHRIKRTVIGRLNLARR